MVPHFLHTYVGRTYNGVILKSRQIFSKRVNTVLTVRTIRIIDVKINLIWLIGHALIGPCVNTLSHWKMVKN